MIESPFPARTLALRYAALWLVAMVDGFLLGHVVYGVLVLWRG